MKQKSIYIICLLTVTVFYSQAQKEAYNWFFGYNAGLTWNNTRSMDALGLGGTATDTLLSNLPTSTSGSKIYTNEGCFTLSDTKGNVLFYSDGSTIWNQIHGVMPNGTALGGNGTSTQSGIVLPFPGRSNQYIAISITHTSGNDMQYAVIDMTQESGLGAVTSRNNAFKGHSGSLAESVTSIIHANKRDYWIVAPGKGSTAYLNAWLVTSDSVHMSVPVTVATLPAGNTGSSNGYIKFTPDGKHFAYATWQGNNLFFGDFDALTGTFSNLKYLANNAYGVEFSPSGKYLYLSHRSSQSTGKHIQVYDFEALLAATDPTTVPCQWYPPTSVLGAVQLGVDGRIYISMNGSTAAYVVDNPEEYPDLRLYQINNFLANGSFQRGLPSFAANWFSVSIDADQSFCVNTLQEFTVTLNQSGSDEIAYTEWDFGEGGAFLKDTNVSSGTQTHSYTYEKPGLYNITVRSYLADGKEAASETITVKVNPCVLPVNPNAHLFN
ncbi:PKD domain-containing protein [Parabacteroides sp. PF5-9]|uniref:PKD domain-containing protein n=1 Tax=Parabacteroides sp. PF5-9 TaxID=1742404 RepID=UPI0024744D8A|nr:PKD domain-containing protein [Parabacteroides sp. PF5-9]MDH6358699.1 hypothetical protein [Parabacteroides sp. PF5-9]